MNKHQEKLYSIVVAAFPGVFKIIVVSMVSKTNGILYAGEFAVVMSLIAFVSVVLIDGLAASLNRYIVNDKCLKRNVEYCLLPFFLVCLIALPFNVYIYILLDSFYSIAFFMGYIVYTVLRKFYVIKRLYRYVVRFDFGLLALYVLTFLIFENPYLCGFVFFIMAFFLSLKSLPFLRRYKELSLCDIDNSSYLYCLNGLLSGGVGYLIPIYIFYTYGAELAGITSLLISYASISLLFPRALGQLYLSKMGQFSNNSEILLNIYKEFFKYNLVCILLLCFLFPMVYIFLYVTSLIYNYEEISVWTLIALLFYYSASQLSLPLSSFLIIYDKPKPIFYANVTYSISVLIFLFFVNYSRETPYFQSVISLGASLTYFFLAIFQAFKFTILRKLSNLNKVF